jgi:hypothetical protein
VDLSEFMALLLLGGAISVASSVVLLYAMYRFAGRPQPQPVASLPSVGWAMPASVMVVAAAPLMSCAGLNEAISTVGQAGWVTTRFGAGAVIEATSIVP